MDTTIQPVFEAPKRGPYRRHTAEFKRTVVARSREAGASVSRVAREFNVNANQVFTWRKQFGEGQCEITSTDAYQLLPVTVTQPGRVPASSVVVKDKAQSAGVIELSVGQAQLRLEGSVDAATLGLVLARLLP